MHRKNGAFFVDILYIIMKEKVKLQIFEPNKYNNIPRKTSVDAESARKQKIGGCLFVLGKWQKSTHSPKST